MPISTKACAGRALFAITVAAACASAAFSQPRTVSSEAGELALETIARGLDHPWALAFLPDGRVLVTERNSGNLRIVSRDGALSSPVEGVPKIFRYKGVTGRSQAGLFDVRLHPEFA
ncbi:hypothetical protein GCM10007973_07710 [Polymorphobacter multimanifer]|uniref:Glucose/arabinose dehydrogenase n=1 Tax=Polymorphobacter multimanifer TaxID=1070431 RepID=A0A841L8C2_9SPHN|nr:glucose/arabinose dehydrogenase [Polymorphobacter multimanifer]GGI73235.1 hypothetical protein GCM10007973_07710 [Polymorphobacter multimanifer]